MWKTVSTLAFAGAFLTGIHPGYAGSVSASSFITNGDFELGNLTGWSRSGFGKDKIVVVTNSSPGSSDSYYGSVGFGSFVAFNAGNTSPGAGIYQNFLTTLGKSYTVSYSVGSTYGGTEDVYAAVYGDDTLTPLIDATSTGSAGAMSPFKFTFVADSSTTRLEFVDVPTNVTVGRDLTLDNVTVFETPSVGSAATAVPLPPAVAGGGALLGCLALGLKGRRRVLGA